MRKVLVTGASGFIGAPCLPRLLKAGYDVHAVSSKPQQPMAGVTWHQADLLDLPEIHRLMNAVKPQLLLHMAWYVAPGQWQTAGADQNLKWIMASLELMRSFRELGGERVVMAGSCTEYDWRYGYCTEGVTPLGPNTVYGAAKRTVYEAFTAYANYTEMSAAWARIFFLYGPREHRARLVPTVITSLLSGRAAKCTHGEQIRDFLHVEDVAAAFVELVGSDVRGAVNIGSGQPVTLKHLISLVAKELNGEQLVELGAIPAPANETPLVVANVDRITHELRWRPTFDLHAGLSHTIDWWRSHLPTTR